jgi:autotransporter translocation and assembly factor TamB
VLERIALGPVCALVSGPECGGEVGARVALRGTAAAPLVELGVQARDLAVGSVSYGVFTLDGRYAGTTAQLDGTLRHPQAGELHVDGTVPVDLAWSGPRRSLDQAPVALTARADHLDLTILHALAPRTLASSAGRLSLAVTVAGPRAAPRLEGELGVDGGTVQLVPAGIPYEDIRVRVRAHGTHVDLDEFRARAGDGTLDVDGGADIPPGGPVVVAVSAHFDRFFAVRREAYEAAVSGDVAVRGPLGGPDVTGTLEIDHAVVRPAALPASVPRVPRDETITVVADVTPTEPPPPERGIEVPGPLTLGVTIKVARNAWIRRNDANIEIAGEIRIMKAANEPPRVIGQIRLLRGWYAFQGRRLTIDQGTITLPARCRRSRSSTSPRSTGAASIGSKYTSPARRRSRPSRSAPTRRWSRPTSSPSSSSGSRRTTSVAGSRPRSRSRR